jgi:hypothetical protein
MWGATRAQRDHGRVAAGQAGDAGEACGGEGLGEGRRWPEGGEPPGQRGEYATRGRSCTREEVNLTMPMHMLRAAEPGSSALPFGLAYLTPVPA